MTMALLADLYVREFMLQSLKAYVKPVVEIMAALPSVVLGFLAGLWLAPMVERVVPGIFLMALIVPGCILVALVLWRTAPRAFRTRLRAGTATAPPVPVTVVARWAS